MNTLLKMCSIGALGILLPLSNTTAQTSFQLTFGGSDDEEVDALANTSDGGLIVAGHTKSFGAGLDDMHIIKFDIDGNVEWDNVIGENIAEFSSEIIQTMDGGYAIIGTTYSFNTQPQGNAYFVKTDAVGDVEFSRSMGPNGAEHGYSMKQTMDGGYIIGGLQNSYGAGGYDFYVVKIDSTGAAEWGNIIGDVGNDECYSIHEMADGSYRMIGTYAVSGSGERIAMMKLSSAGAHVWTKTIYENNVNLDIMHGIQTSDGNFVFTGFRGSSMDLKLYIGKIDTAGNSMWNKAYGGSGSEFGYGVAEAANGDILACGYTDSYGAGAKDALVVRTDANGNTQWVKTYGYAGDDVAKAVIENSQGGVTIGGYETTNGAGGKDMWLLKTAANGYMVCDTVGLGSVVGVPSGIVDTIPVVGGSTETPQEQQLWIVMPITSLETSGGVANVLCSDSLNSIVEFGGFNAEVYPNPFNEEINITLEDFDQYEVEIYSITGAILKRELFNGMNANIQLSDLPYGTYIINIRNKTGVEVRKKIIK